ncbi:glycoside hydrolase superfamily [Pavlovales sp. CCMP2436]|nr:glycoside hydrolase superfamily [Pavlovales sp. CCMP2436]
MVLGCVYCACAIGLRSSACTLLSLGLVLFALTNGAMWIATSSTQADVAGANWREAHAGMIGTNLGGWLLLEKWLVDRGQSSLGSGKIVSPFELTAAKGAIDERSLSIGLRAGGRLDALDAWRDAYVTKADFKEIRLAELDSVRIPFGWWIVVGSAAPDGFHRGAGLRYLDDAMRWAEEEGLKVILDLHGAPGSQNGRQTGGHEAKGWTTDWFDVDKSVEVVRIVAERYAFSSALVGITLLNEPEGVRHPPLLRLPPLVDATAPLPTIAHHDGCLAASNGSLHLRPSQPHWRVVSQATLLGLLDLERACARGGLVAAARADQRLVAAGPHQAGAGADAGASYGPSALTRIARTLPAA